tara:strand:+ start:1305 stop:1772 length:468 start_codon:yes stop_codon:yes gene_type:complete
MIDPITAISVAASAVSNIKSLMLAGRDASSALSRFAGAVSDVNYCVEKSKSPGIFASLTGSAEQQAIDAFSAHKKMQALRQEVETMVQFSYGMDGLQEYKDTLRRVRAQRKKTAYRRAEIKEALIQWAVGLLAAAIGLGIFGVIVYFIGIKNGNW